MKIVLDIEQQREVAPKAVTVGFFDGVHAGHRFLIGELCRIAREKGLPSAIVTFDRHPRKTLGSDNCPPLITTKEEKIEAFETLGVDYCYFLHFTKDMAALPAKEFMRDVLKKRIGTSILLVGYDHRFGSGRSDSFEAYIRYGKETGIGVILAPPLLMGENTPGSSIIRQEILTGNMGIVTKLLGRPYKIDGKVVSGFGVGRKLGFPTANLQINDREKMIPPDGVYAVTVFVEKNPSPYKGMLYIGTRPTLNNGQTRSIEVNIFDFDKDVYNRQLTVEIHKYIRSAIRFNNLAALQQQLEIDKKKVLAIL